MSEVDVDDFLEHFGVKGMKWGVRKESETTDGSATETLYGSRFSDRLMGVARHAKTDEKWLKIANSREGQSTVDRHAKNLANKDNAWEKLETRHKKALS